MLKRLGLVLIGGYFASTVIAAIVVADIVTVVVPWILRGNERD